MSRKPWYQRHPADWQNGTIGMSLELRGFYSEFLDAMWQRQSQLPKDDKWLAMATRCSPRMVRACIAKLIAAGKVIETETGYYNPRMMADILCLDAVAPDGQFAPVSRPTQPRVERESRPTRARTEREPSAKIKKSPMNSTRDLESESKKDSYLTTTTCSSPAREGVVDVCPGELLKKLEIAGAAALAHVVNAPGLMNASVPLMWLDQGADLERDVLPAVRQVAAARAGKGQIRDWNYFSQAVANAKATRERGLPEATATVASPGDWRAQKAAKARSLMLPDPSRSVEAVA